MRFSTKPKPFVQEQDYSNLSALVKLPIVLKGTVWNCQWRSQCSGKIKNGKAVSPGKNMIEVPELETGFGHALIEIGDFYRSPAYPSTKVSSKITLKSLFGINGTLNKKCFSGKTVSLYPEEGFNELIFTLEPGKTAEFLTDTEIGLPVKWHFSAPGIEKNITYIIYAVVGNVIFLLYDILITRLVSLYIFKLRDRIGFGRKK